MIILALEYKFKQTDEWANIPLRQNSGFYSETSQQTESGTVYTQEITAYIPHLSAEKQVILTELAQHPAIYRIIDTSEFYHEIGTAAEPAMFSSVKKLGPAPGIAHGWDAKIVCKSTTPAKITSFS